FPRHTEGLKKHRPSCFQPRAEAIAAINRLDRADGLVSHRALRLFGALFLLLQVSSRRQPPDTWLRTGWLLCFGDQRLSAALTLPDDIPDFGALAYSTQPASLCRPFALPHPCLHVGQAIANHAVGQLQARRPLAALRHADQRHR